MKKLKYLLLLIMFLMITGCGYDDIYKENKEALDNLNCSYTSANYGSFDAYPSSKYDITVTADSKGVYFSHGGEKYNIVKNNNIRLGDYNLVFSNDNMSNFLNNYIKNGCPNQFFATGKLDDLQNLYIEETCGAGDGVHSQCFLYKLSNQNENEVGHKISKSPVYNRYVKAINKQVKYSFSYDFDSETSYLEVDGVKYEIKDKSLMEPINQTTNYWEVYPTDYDDIFKINETNETVDWPELVFVMQKSADQYQVLYFTINLEEYEVRNDFKDAEEAKYGNWNPNKLCDNGDCNIDITKFCNDPYVARTLKFLGLLLAIAKVIVPALIIGLGFVDLAKIVMSGKVDEAKKQGINIIKRVVIGIVIFLIPTILITIYNVAYSIANDSEEVTEGELNVPTNFKNCVGCILDANNKDACIVNTN